VRVWDGWDPKEATLTLALASRPSFAQFGRHSDSIVVQTWDGATTIYDSCSGQPVLEPITGIDFNRRLRASPDGIGLWTVTSGKDKQLVEWDVRSGEARPGVLSHAGAIRAVRIDLANNSVLTAGAGVAGSDAARGAVQRWDLSTAERRGKPLQHDEIVTSIDTLSDGTVLTGSKERRARVWRPGSVEPRTTPSLGGQIFSVRFDSTGRRFVTADGSGVAQVWHTDPLESIGAPMQHGGPIYQAEFSPEPEGRWVVTASQDGTARMFDATTGRPRRWKRADEAETDAIFRHICEAARCEVVSAHFSPDGKYVATAAWDNTARIWSAENGEPLSDPLSHDEYVVVAAFDPSGRRLLTASYDGTARLWSAPGGHAIGRRMEHGGKIEVAVFSIDGDLVVTGGRDGAVRLWDGREGIPVSPPLEVASEVTAIELTAPRQDASRLLVVSTAQGKAQIFTIHDGRGEGHGRDLGLLAESLAGLRANEELSEIDAFPGAARQLVEFRARAAAATPGSLDAWLFGDRWARPIAPGVAVSMEDEIQRCRRECSDAAWSAMFRRFRDHPFLVNVHADSCKTPPRGPEEVASP
jgi:WD40 repeat protein